MDTENLSRGAQFVENNAVGWAAFPAAACLLAGNPSMACLFGSVGFGLAAAVKPLTAVHSFIYASNDSPSKNYASGRRLGMIVGCSLKMAAMGTVAAALLLGAAKIKSCENSGAPAPAKQTISISN